MNNTPFISIIIPTRQREETLKYTIKTILEQSFQNYEIIVSDNNSSPRTKEVVESYNTNKIKYIRSEKDLSLPDNWEQGLSIAKGTYVTIIADNDGFIKGSLEFLFDLIQFNKYPELISLVKNTYNWPCLNSKNKDLIILNKNPSLQLIDGHELIKEVVEDNSKFFKLPMIYNSIVHSNLIKKMKKKGKVFNACAPDIYSGFVLAHLAKKYLLLSLPLTIAGNSSKSLGFNCSRNNKEVIHIEDKVRKSSDIQLHPHTSYVTSHTNITSDAFLRTNDLFNLGYATLDRKIMLKNIIEDAKIYSEEDLILVKEKILKSCEDDKELLPYVNNLFDKNLLKISTLKENKISFGFNATKLILNAKHFNISNIHQASEFMFNFYDYSINSINYPEISNNLDMIEKDAEIAIWGRGVASLKLMKLIKIVRPDLNVLYMVDSFHASQTSVPITIKPENIDNGIKYIIIASMFIHEISNTINTLNLNNDILVQKYTHSNN